LRSRKATADLIRQRLCFAVCGTPPALWLPNRPERSSVRPA
jgi:hypothetical protein